MSDDDDFQDGNKQQHSNIDHDKHTWPDADDHHVLEALKVKPNLYSGSKPATYSILAKWLKVLTQPSIVTFTSEVPNANWTTPLLGMLIFAVIYILVTIVGIAPWYGGLDVSPSITLVSEAYFFTANGLLIISALTYGIVKGVSKGTSDFVVRTYLYSLYVTPLIIVAYLLSLVPSLLFYAPLAAFIYALFLTYYMVQAVYGLDASSARKVIFLLSTIPFAAYFSSLIFFAFTVKGF